MLQNGKVRIYNEWLQSTTIAKTIFDRTAGIELLAEASATKFCRRQMGANVRFTFHRFSEKCAISQFRAFRNLACRIFQSN